MSVKILKDDVRKLLSNIEAMTQKRVLIGIPGELAARPGEPVSNAALGYIHEFGSPAANIPARPFLNPGIQDALPEIIPELAISARRALKTPGAYEIGLERAGIRATTAVKKRIRSQEGFVPLAERTLKAREKAGFKGTKALIRTGQLLNSITHVIRSK